MIKEHSNIDEETMENLLDSLYANFGQLYTALEQTRDNGINVLTKIGVDEGTATTISEIAHKELERNSVSLGGKIRCSLYVKNGLEIFKDAIFDAIETAKQNEALDVYVQNISAPDYRITIEADDWKKAEKSWKAFQDAMDKNISNSGTRRTVAPRITRSG